jgi:hypothetical protein
MISSPRKPTRFAVRRRFAVGLPATLALAVAVSPAAYGADAATRADLRFTNYAFAHEFGSGVYDFNGRTLQVYGLPFGWTAVEPGKDQAGLRLRLPVTLGFLDFHAADVIETGLPDRVDSVSVVPGIEIELVVAERWRLLPFVQGGMSTASEADVETDLFGTGIRALWERDSTASYRTGASILVTGLASYIFKTMLSEYQ